MADLFRMQQDPRPENPGLFADEAANIDIIRFESPSGLPGFTIIRGASPTTSNFNTGTELGDVIIDTDTGKWYLKVGATTWTVCGSVT